MNHIDPTIARFLSPWVPPAFLNDDDIYVIDTRSLEVVQEIGASSPMAQEARLTGVPAKPGCAVLRGMQARSFIDRELAYKRSHEQQERIKAENAAGETQ